MFINRKKDRKKIKDESPKIIIGKRVTRKKPPGHNRDEIPMQIKRSRKHG